MPWRAPVAAGGARQRETIVLVTCPSRRCAAVALCADQILTMTYTSRRGDEAALAALFGQDCPHPREICTINGVSSKIIAYYAQNCAKGRLHPGEDESALAKLVSDPYRDLCGEALPPRAW